jgi:hypothetical protein
MASNNTANVSTGKPKAGGAVFVAPAGTSLPTDATTALGDAFVNVGLISEDGVTISRSEDSSDFRDWEGNVVASENGNFAETMKMTFIETNETTMGLVWGGENVTAGDNGGLAMVHAGGVDDEHVLVVEVKLRGGKRRRNVVPRAKLSSVDDVTYKRDALISYSCTFKDLSDDAGAASYEYVGTEAVDNG